MVTFSIIDDPEPVSQLFQHHMSQNPQTSSLSISNANDRSHVLVDAALFTLMEQQKIVTGAILNS